MNTGLFFENESAFNDYVAAHTAGSVLQTTNWGKLKQTTGWEYYPVAIVDEGNITAATLILARKIPLLGVRMFYSPRGPLYSTSRSLAELKKEVSKLARQKRASVWKMDPALPVGDPVWNRFVQENNLVHQETGLDFGSIQPRFIMDVDITPSHTTLLNNMKSKTRYNIRYATRKGVNVKRSTDKQDIYRFYALLQETAERDNFTVRSIAYLENLWEHLILHDLAHLFLAYHDKKTLAGAILFKLGKRAWYVYGASSNHKRNLQASHLIQWEMIKWAKSFGCTVYDFRGVSGDVDPSNPLYGLYRFKEGFNAKLQEYVGEYDLPLSYVSYPLWKFALKLHNQRRESNKTK